jgi:hypothetical protein
MQLGAAAVAAPLFGATPLAESPLGFLHRVLADAVLLFHLGFILFVLFGALLAVRWRRVLWLHVPCALWGIAVELLGWICPLTPLENELRSKAGMQGYSGGFVERYVIPVVYPADLTRLVQIAAGGLALGINVGIYAWVLKQRGILRRAATFESAPSGPSA